MRRKKHKHTRRALRFYRITHGFRPPYKVLLDGNFVHALDQMKKGESKDLIGRLLGDAVKCYTTPCVQAELKKLGKDFSAARQLLKRYPLHKCGHEDKCSAADCLKAQLGDKNGEHFFVATQDRALQRACMAVPGGAVLFASVNGVHLETPSELQKQAAKQEERRHMAPSETELKSAALAEVAAAQQQRARPQLRRKKAKGPNPLAVQKPKKVKKAQAAGGGGGGGGSEPKQQQQQEAAAAGAAGGEQAAAKKKRQRRRGKGAAEGGGGGAGSGSE
ncbi:rRNA-processing UTP23-like protein [Chlorella sorokiniana]|uniref:rRNA-processing UTP23-like protein n=1 Tax=Chlorella sorokiniana TaxID=3076 RepID=A0A2P6TNS3_CHLSO|nr:rRNA-processing UTP23-like protein [Chlorella sorokiniana]|eukprot:PRW50990.1 rRNA-processing UTP23-like protein [Chlorella sorokiniana]